MNTRAARLTGLIVAVGWLLGCVCANAYERYTEGCDNCHGAFADTTSAKTNNTWSSDKHDVHQTMVNNNCTACHVTVGDNPRLNQSGGGGGLPGIGCVGCHGNNHGSDASPSYTAAGLRAHHAASGISSCANCHGGDPSPVGENVLPAYYGKSGIALTDSCNSNGSENWTSDGKGLDNDGDLAYDGSDPDCQIGPCPDADGDGYVASGNCTIPPGKLPGDCDDANAAINPGATEVCDDGIDNDCDGQVDAADSNCGTESFYVGSQTCAACHKQQYNDWNVSGHPQKLAKAAVARKRPLPLPEGFTWSDISYVIGGYKWKARFLNNSGYIITSTATGTAGKNQYNLMTGKWSDYNPGKTLPYDCGSCHTTGYSATGHQDGRPGIVGTWAMEGVQCESCHGPGKGHVEQGTPILVDRRVSACGACHVRGDPNIIPAKDGFIEHHEQYNELLASPHGFLECVACHNPHKKSEFSVKKDCASCHKEIADAYAGTRKDALGIKCVDCHMPMATKSAASLGPHKGDVKTHIFKINTSRYARFLFIEGPRTRVQLDERGKASVTLDFACQQCHVNKDLGWAERYAVGFHQSKLGTSKVKRSTK